MITLVFSSVVGESGPLAERWKWSRPNANVYTLLIQGLAAVLRVSDALRVIRYICEIGVSPGEEVRFSIFKILCYAFGIVSQRLDLPLTPMLIILVIAGSVWEDSQMP